MSLLLLNEDELRQLITLPKAITAVRRALLASAEGRVETPGNFGLSLPEVKGNVKVTGVYLNESPYVAIWVTNRFHDNPTIGLPSESGLLAVFDAATGFPAAILLDNGYLATLRLGAEGALTADALANPGLEKMAILGAHSSAYLQLKTLFTVRQPNQVYIWDALPVQADNLIRQMIEEHSLNFQLADAPQDAVNQADLVVVTDVELVAPLAADWIKPGAHITVLSTDQRYHSPRLSVELLKRAERLIADDPARSLQSGEFAHLRSQSDVAPREPGRLCELIAGKLPGRTHPDQITIAELTGSTVHDSVLATIALGEADFLGLGQRLEAGLPQKSAGATLEALL